MNEWGVFLVITSLLGFVGSVFALANKLTAPINGLIAETKALRLEMAHNRELDGIRDGRLEKHGREIDVVKESISDHESRLRIIETTKYTKVHVD